MAIDRLVVIEPRDQLVERGARLGLGDGLFEFADLGGDHVAVDVRGLLGDVGENGQAGRRDFGKAAQHDNLLLTAFAMESRVATLEMLDEVTSDMRLEYPRKPQRADAGPFGDPLKRTAEFRFRVE